MGLQYTKEQRKEIIRLHTEGANSTRYLANKYQIGRTTIQSWLREYRNETGETSQPQNRKVVNCSKDALVKKKGLKEIQMQLVVLKSFQKELERWYVRN